MVFQGRNNLPTDEPPIGGWGHDGDTVAEVQGGRRLPSPSSSTRVLPNTTESGSTRIESRVSATRLDVHRCSKGLKRDFQCRSDGQTRPPLLFQIPGPQPLAARRT